MPQQIPEKKIFVLDVRDTKIMLIYVGKKKIRVLINKPDHKKHFIKGNFFYVTEHGYVGCKNYIGVFNGKSKYSNRYLHRMIMSAPKGLTVDHINGDRLDNRRCNLRLCSNRDNNLNKKGRGRYKGVYFNKVAKKWTAQIGLNSHIQYLGLFDTPEEAAIQYNKFAQELHGEYAYLNRLLVK